MLLPKQVQSAASNDYHCGLDSPDCPAPCQHRIPTSVYLLGPHQAIPPNNNSSFIGYSGAGWFAARHRVRICGANSIARVCPRLLAHSLARLWPISLPGTLLIRPPRERSSGALRPRRRSRRHRHHRQSAPCNGENNGKSKRSKPYEFAVLACM